MPKRTHERSHNSKFSIFRHSRSPPSSLLLLLRLTFPPSSLLPVRARSSSHTVDESCAVTGSESRLGIDERMNLNTDTKRYGKGTARARSEDERSEAKMRWDARAVGQEVDDSSSWIFYFFCGSVLLFS